MDKKRALMSSKAFPEIAGLASRFISFLRRHPLPGMLDLASPPDVDRLFVALEVEGRARLDGGNDLPPSSEEVISGTQKEIIDYHRRLQAQARAKVKKLARRLLTEARRFDPSEVVDRLRDIPSKCENKAERALADFNSRLTLLHEQVEYEHDMESDTDRYLNHKNELAVQKGVSISKKRSKGSVHKEIVSAVKDEEIDLLIIGELSRIRSRRDEFYDEAERAMRNVPCSVLIAKDEDRVWEMYQSLS